MRSIIAEKAFVLLVMKELSSRKCAGYFRSCYEHHLLEPHYLTCANQTHMKCKYTTEVKSPFVRSDWRLAKY